MDQNSPEGRCLHARWDVTRRKFIKISAATFGAVALSPLISGCGGSGEAGGDDANTFPVLVFSDIHFNPFFDPSLFAALDVAPASDWAAIFATSSIKAPASWSADANYPSLVLALAGITQNLAQCAFVIYTGDLLGHNFPVLFKQCNGGVQDEAAMKAFADKTVDFLLTQIRAAVGSLPVMFVVGNADSYLGALPEPSFLANNAELYYSKFLNGSADHQAFLGSFTRGGYYAAQPSANLTVIGLNTVPFGFSSLENEVQAELNWLDASLASAQAMGRKVWLLMHVPPGAVLGATATTAGNVASNGHITTATMMWTAGRYERFMAVLAKYPRLITMTLGAHTHMDEYRVLSPGNVLEITPAISPVFGNNPAFKVFNVASDTLRATDYQVFNCDLAAQPGRFSSDYRFSATYSMSGFLDVSLSELRPQLVSDGAKQAAYRGNYYSGNNTMNPITDTNWPIYWCGIGEMVEQAFIDAVNAY